MIRVIVAGFAVFVASTPLVAGEAAVARENADVLKAEIEARCQERFEEHGEILVSRCVEKDWESAQQVMRYRRSDPDVSRRCIERQRANGFEAIAHCIKRELGATEAPAYE